MRIMKKSTLLSLLTVAMIIVATVGTFAVWDQMEATSEGGTVTIGNAVTMSITTPAFQSASARTSLTDDVTSMAIESEEVTVNVENLPDGVVGRYFLEVNAAAFAEGNEAQPAEDVSVNIAAVEGNDGLATGVTAYKYKVTVTPTAPTAAGKSYTVLVHAKLAENQM